MRRLLGVLFSIAALFAVSSPALAQTTSSVVVHVENVRSSRGHVRVELCTADTFLTQNCILGAAAPARKGETDVTVLDVPPGVYAVQVFHDANDDQKVNRGAFGIPSEDLGFSREAPIGLRGPQFTKASFVHAADVQVVTLHLRHF